MTPTGTPTGSTAVGTVLDREDRAALADMVREFVRAEIAPLTCRPEDPIRPDAVDGVLARFAELGVLTGDGEPGAGIWDLPGQPPSCALSLQILSEIAGTAPGIAYAVHLRALAGWLDRAAGLPAATSLVSFDRVGVAAGRATGRALAADQLSDHEIAELEIAWGEATSQSQQLLVGADSWANAWWPRWRRTDGWQLVRIPRTALTAAPLPHPHGLDELTYLGCHGGTEDAVLGAGQVIDAFALHGLGVLAIAAATVERAVARARDYSRTRRQGGELIAVHDAVAQLLARSQQSLATARAVLDHLVGLPPGLGRLHQVWRARAQLHPLLSAAGSDALQVFGGIGYMRDVGAEKDLRDLNALRRLGGSPMELTLRCAALDDWAGVTS